MLSMLCAILVGSMTASANEVTVINEGKDRLAFGFLVPLVIIVVAVGGLIIAEIIRRHRDNQDKLF